MCGPIHIVPFVNSIEGATNDCRQRIMCGLVLGIPYINSIEGVKRWILSLTQLHKTGL